MKTLVTALVYILGGALIIRFARSAYRHPDDYLARWFEGYILPPFRWTRRRVQGFAVFWIFAAVLIITSGVGLVFPLLPRLPLFLWIASCLLFTLPLIPRRSTPPTKRGSGS